MADDNIEKVLGGRYRVDSLIEEFFFARLYQGTNITIDRPVTIKVVDKDYSDFQTDIFDEARKVSRISHPNVLTVTDLGTDDDGTAFVIYEAVDGESLKTAMASDERFEIERAISIVRQSAAAVTAVRPFRPVSGTLVRPENILLVSGDAPETVKALNFFGGDAFNRPYATNVSGNERPTLSLLAPEAVKGGEADERTEVYTLGSLLYQMLAGEAAFSADSASDSIAQICNDPPPPMSSFRADLPDDLERVILTAMAKNPEMRYQTVAEFSNELERFVSGPGQASDTAAVAPSHDIWKTAFVVLAGISLLTVALIYATSVKQTNPATQLQADANGQPVQPINPATGIQEQNLANMQGMSADTLANSNSAIPPGTLPGGDGYDPWKNGVQPPPGAPRVGPGGQVVTIDPNNPSPFMTNDGPCIPQPSGILLCPAPITNKAVKPTPTPKPNAANANVQVTTTPTPKPETRPSPAVQKTPTVKPTPIKNPASSGKPKNGDEL